MPSRPFRFDLKRAVAPVLVLLALAGCTRNAPPAEGQAAPQASAATAPAQVAPDAKPAADVPGLKAGVEYVEISGGEPFQPTPGRIEVVEVFGYTCPHCATFEPLLQAWAAKQPADVRVVPVAAPFGGPWDPYAKAFFAAQAMGVQEKSHRAMFEALHVKRSLPVQPMPTDQQLGAFYAGHGVDAAQFAGTLASFPVQAQMQKARAWIERAGVDSTPTLVVDGQTFEDQLRIADALIAHVRATRTAVP